MNHRGARWKRGRRAKNLKLFEKIIKENFPNLVKKIDIQVQEAQRVPNKMDIRGPQKDTSTSSQEGSVGRHTVPPRTTKRRTTTI